LQTEDTAKWKQTHDNKEVNTKAWSCSDVASLKLKTITAQLDLLRKVEVVWNGINFDKLMHIVADFETVMKRMQKENSGIVIEEIRTLKKFPDEKDIFNKQVWFVRQKFPMLSSRELLVFTFNKRIVYDGKPCVLNVMQSVEYPDTPVHEGSIRI